MNLKNPKMEFWIVILMLVIIGFLIGIMWEVNYLEHHLIWIEHNCVGVK
jgi:hypothetical protein